MNKFACVGLMWMLAGCGDMALGTGYGFAPGYGGYGFQPGFGPPEMGMDGFGMGDGFGMMGGGFGDDDD